MTYVKLEDVLNIIRNENHNLAGLINHIEEHCPTADVAEVKHGEWTKVDVMGNGYGQIYYQHKECPVSSTELFTCPYEYCPRCGAKMNGGKAE